MFPLLPADALRALGLALIPLAWAVAGWPSGAVMFLVFGAQWLLRWLRGGSLLDWSGQIVLLAAGWFSVTGLYHRVEPLDLVMHAAASAVIAMLVAVVAGAWLRRRGTAAQDVQRLIGRALTWLVLVSATLALGAVWELAEWWGHHVVAEEIGVGYDDTMGDLLADLVGGAAGAAAALASGRRGGGARAGRASGLLTPQDRA